MPTTEETIYNFLVRDFTTAWDAVAHQEHADGRGNFIFGRHAMALLEWVSRLCWSDSSGNALKDYSAALHAVEPKYFTALPGPCADTQDFELPGMSGGNASPVSPPQAQLLWAIFDLGRHGLGHQNLPIGVTLTDGKLFGIGFTGAEHNLDLVASALGGSGVHLQFRRDSAVLALTLRTDLMFRHLRDAAEASELLGRNLAFEYLTRPKVPSLRPRATYSGPRYQFTSDQLASALVNGGHRQYTIS